MKVQKIELENFRGFLKAEVEFNENMNVFIGSNASGKTTLLLGILKGLYKLFEQFGVTSGPIAREYLRISDNDINTSKDYFQINLFLNKNSSIVPININKGNLPDDQRKLSLMRAKHFNLFYKKYINEVSGNVKNVPIIKFYPANRGAIQDKKITTSTNLQNPQWETWWNIYQDDISYSKFFKWFFDLETKELRLQRDNQNFSIQQPEIKFVRFAVEEALKILFNESYKIKSDQIKRNGSNELIPILRIAKEGLGNPGEELKLKSDGEKAIITLVADIAYNLAIANNFESQENYLESPGIVMIDEIEAHLHPNWQRAILPLLRELFPNIQFFVTTHSPQVIASVSSEHVFVCDNFEVSKIRFKTKGVDSNTLLTHIFNATDRPKEVIELVEAFYDLMDDSASIIDLENKIKEIENLEANDNGMDISPLVEELQLTLEAHKFDLEHETN